MSDQPIQYAALIPSGEEQKKLAQLVEFASLAPGFKPIPPQDAHLTVGFNTEGFSDEAVAMLKNVQDVELQSAVAQGLQRKHGNLHLMYAKNTKQIAVAIEFPSHQVNELKAKLQHTFDGRLSLSHMTIGVIAPEALNLTLEQIETLTANQDYDGVQRLLDGAFSGFLQSEAGQPLTLLSEMPINLRMEKVHASAHTECPLDITDHPNPISTRENALDHVKHHLLQSPMQAVSGWVDKLFGASEGRAPLNVSAPVR